jgi:hypothetical protein
MERSKIPDSYFLSFIGILTIDLIKIFDVKNLPSWGQLFHLLASRKTKHAKVKSVSNKTLLEKKCID